MFLRQIYLALAPLKKTWLRYGCALFLLTACGSPKPASEEPATTPPPNILLIVADDLGWTDLAVYGSSFYETPNLDALAADGIRFTNGYATCPVCSPSRSSIQTGKYPVRTGVTDWIKGRKSSTGPTPNDRWIAADTDYELALTETTLAEVLAPRGYTTFFAGKWHLGEDSLYWPEQQGYDYNVGGWSKGAPQRRADGPPNGYFSPYGNPRLPDGPDGEYLPDRLTDETIAFLDQQEENKPFFINLSYYLVHNPLQAKPERIAYYERKRAEMGLTPEVEMDRSGEWIAHATGGPGGYKERVVQGNPIYAAMVESLDANIGRLIDHLKTTGQYDNTLILFTSDNGGLSTAEGSPTANLPLRGGKGWIYEGGIRVPFMVKNVAGEPAGTTADAPVCGADILPTLAVLLEIELPESDLDGVALQPLLQRSDSLPERPLFWHYPHYSNQGGNPASAVRLGRYKLIHDLETGAYELYDLSTDLGEQNNLIDRRPELALQLKQLLTEWRTKNEAKTLRPNPKWNGREPIVE